MKNILQLYIVLAFMPVMVDAESKEEFSGKWSTQNIKTFIGETLLVSTPTTIDDSEAFFKREIMTETGEWIELKAISSGVAADGRIGNQYSLLPGTKLRRAFRCPRRTTYLQEAYSFLNEGGGHFHDDIPAPLLSVSSPSLDASTATFYAVPSPMIWTTIQPGVTYYYWEQFPLFGTMIIEEFYSDLCGQWTDTIYVQIPGLKPMPKGMDYVLYSSEDAKKNHPYNHYGTPVLIDTIKSIAAEYKATVPDAEPLQIGDMSLFTGGIFDINHNWTVPHTGHTLGTDADIGKSAVPRKNREKLLKILCRRSSETFLDPDFAGFYHVTVPAKIGAVKNIFEKAVRCCVGNEIDPDNIAACTAD